MLDIKQNIFLKDYTTLGVGGPVDKFVVVATKEEMQEALTYATQENLDFIVIGSGSNLLIADAGYRGMVIKNEMEGIQVKGCRVKVLSGTLLQDLVETALQNGLSGLERLVGIPGTVGGAIYGNAGAYGRTISDNLEKVLVLAKQGRYKVLSQKECQFGYRDSFFKREKDWVIVEAEFCFEKKNPEELKKNAHEFLTKRLKVWKPNMKSPGSFFKNIIASNLPPAVLSKIPKDKIIYGKIPAGWLLESVGAKGDRIGGAAISQKHANLFINTGKARAADFYKLGLKYKKKVKEKFGITLEPEVQLIGFSNGL